MELGRLRPRHAQASTGSDNPIQMLPLNVLLAGTRCCIARWVRQAFANSWTYNAETTDQSFYSLSSLTLGAHAQRGLR